MSRQKTYAINGITQEVPVTGPMMGRKVVVVWIGGRSKDFPILKKLTSRQIVDAVWRVGPVNCPVIFIGSEPTFVVDRSLLEFMITELRATMHLETVGGRVIDWAILLDTACVVRYKGPVAPKRVRDFWNSGCLFYGAWPVKVLKSAVRRIKNASK